MMIETSGSNMAHDEEKLNKFLLDTIGKSLVKDDAVPINEPGKMQEFWKIRENAANAVINYEGHCFIYDISLPLKNFFDIVPAMRERVGDLATFVCGFGHLGEFLKLEH